MRDNFLSRYLAKLQSAGIKWIILNPLASLLINPVALFKSLCNLRMLDRGGLRYYNGYSSTMAFVNLFYWNEALNLQRHGRNGFSPTLGFGNFDMRRLWFQSLLAVTMTSAIGTAMTNLVGMSVWYASHLLWFYDGQQSPLFVVITLLCALCSNNFYGNLFGSQNYNVFAWAFFPVGLWGMMNNHFWLTALAWLVIPFLSISVFAIAAMMTVVFCLICHDVVLALTLLPGGIYFARALQLFDIKKYGDMKEYVVDLLAMIGAIRSNCFKRSFNIVYPLCASTLLLSMPLAIFALGIRTMHLSSIDLVLISIAPAIFFFVNESNIIRIADTQTSFMLVFSVTTAITIASSSYALLVLYWLINSNALISIRLYNFDTGLRDKIRATPVVRPFNIKPFLNRMESFAEGVLPGQRVLAAFNNPGNDYDAVFDGHGTLYDPFFYISNNNGIHVMPDWFAVVEINSMEAPRIWGRTPLEVRTNMDCWQADYALIYTVDNDYDENEWRANGLYATAVFSWTEFRKELEHSPLVAAGWPVWRLMGRCQLIFDLV